MKGLPPELIYVLIFVGIILFQILTKRRRSPDPRESGQGARVPQPTDGISTMMARLEQPDPMAWGSSRPSVDPPARTDAPAAIRVRPRRRFARQSLMGTRRDVQNALVIATILGPCRALEPPGGEAASTTPPRASR
jgi:hypothetical protein